MTIRGKSDARTIDPPGRVLHKTYIYGLVPGLILVLTTIVVLFPSCTDGKMDKKNKAQLEAAVRVCHDNILFDSHIDWPYRVEQHPEDISGRTVNGDFDFVRAGEGGLNAALTVAYVQSGFDVDKGRSMVDSTLNLVKYYIGKYPDRFAAASSPEDIRANFGNNLLSLPVGLENGSPIGDDLGYLRYLKDNGIVYITLCHNRVNNLSDSNFDGERQWNGLSPFGIAAIREMNRLGLMIDISHSTDSTVYQALRYSVAPVVATHSSCREFAPGMERNLPDTLIKAIAAKNGVVMVNFGSYFLEPECMGNWLYLINNWSDSTGIEAFSPGWIDFMIEYGKTHRLRSDAAKVADHIDHIVSLTGIDFVGIGSDFDGIDHAQPVDMPDVSGYPALVSELLKRGYTEDDLRKIMAENFLRVWTDVLNVSHDLMQQ
jgi:membrane dipeptidase